MPQIGSFTRTGDGFSGRIRTLSFETEFVLVRTPSSDSETAPDYRIHLGDADGPEVGAGWTRNGERAGEFVALLLDDPVFLAPVRANLFRLSDDDSTWGLHWSRPGKRVARN